MPKQAKPAERGAGLQDSSETLHSAETAESAARADCVRSEALRFAWQRGRPRQSLPAFTAK